MVTTFKRAQWAGALAAGVMTIWLLLAGCGGAGGEATIFETAASSAAPPMAPPAQYQIGLIMKTLTNPFFIEMEKGARRAQSELGVKLVVKTGAQETSIEQQITIVEEMITAGMDAIVIAPGSSTELIPVLKKAQDAGIVVVNIDNRLDAALSEELGLVDVPFISVDNEQGAYLSAGCIVDKIDGPANVAILEGIREAKNAQDRKAGAERAFAETPQITVVVSETAHWKIDEGYAVTKNIFEKHPDITGVFAANDMMGLGAIKYLEENGRQDVLVAGYDALEEAVAMVAEGKMLCTIDQQAAEQGYLGIQYAVRALDGETLPAETMVDVRLITQP